MIQWSVLWGGPWGTCCAPDPQWLLELALGLFVPPPRIEKKLCFRSVKGRKVSDALILSLLGVQGDVRNILTCTKHPSPLGSPSRAV